MFKSLVHLRKLMSFKRPMVFLILSLLLVSIFLLPHIAVLAQNPEEESSVAPPATDPKTGLVDLRGLTISDVERLYPTCAAAEAAIVHQIPLVPLIIDGVPYAPDQISLFNGKRLRFINGRDGKLYAFTTVEGLEQFMQQLSTQPARSSLLESIIQTIFYLDWWYMGSSVALPPGYGMSVLPLGFDNAISSVSVSDSASYAFLFDDTGYGGNYFIMERGSDHSMLTFEGWNDRASSIWVTG